jgi:uracil-DNA glycosylase family 4
MAAMRQDEIREIDAAFAALCRSAGTCRRCPRMAERSAVLGPGNGRPGARCMFIAEAPGRLGADRTGVPLRGDRSGDNFERLIAGAGLSRAQIFVTNAVLCNPRDDRGNNRRPSNAELGNCSTFLRAQIDIVNPEVVVTLGTVALAAVAAVEPHRLVLRLDVARSAEWYNRLLLPLYHPGPRALIRRPWERQEADYRVLSDLLNALPSPAFAASDCAPATRSAPAPSAE